MEMNCQNIPKGLPANILTSFYGKNYQKFLTIVNFQKNFLNKVPVLSTGSYKAPKWNLRNLLLHKDNIEEFFFHCYESCEQFFGGTELENGFEKSKDFITYWIKAFSSDIPQSLKCQKKGPKEHDEKYVPSCGYIQFQNWVHIDVWQLGTYTCQTKKLSANML